MRAAILPRFLITDTSHKTTPTSHKAPGAHRRSPDHRSGGTTRNQQSPPDRNKEPQCSDIRKKSSAGSPWLSMLNLRPVNTAQYGSVGIDLACVKVWNQRKPVNSQYLDMPTGMVLIERLKPSRLKYSINGCPRFNTTPSRWYKTSPLCRNMS